MPSTFSPNLRIELIGAGEQAGTWGTTTNTNLGTLVEDAIAGYTAVTISSADQALTSANGAADQARNAMIQLNSASAPFAVYAPPESKQYVVFNNTAHVATIFNSTALGNTTAAGTGVTIPAGKNVTVWSDGTNFAFQNTYVAPVVFTDIANLIYPVGSVYVNATNNTNPGALLGFGTWSAFGAGRVPVGFNASDPLFDTAEETGGSKDAILVSHTHTATSVVSDPSHNHTSARNGTGGTGLNLNGFSAPSFDGDNDGPIPTTSVTTGITVSTTNASAGSSGTNANLQPYITVYMWKRTA